MSTKLKHHPLGQHAQSQHLGQPASVGTVIGILETVVLLHRCGVGQMHPVAGLHQPVDEPVPVIGRLYHHTGDVFLILSSLLQNRGQMVGEALLIDHLVLLIESLSGNKAFTREDLRSYAWQS